MALVTEAEGEAQELGLGRAWLWPPTMALTHCPPAGQWPLGLCQADGCHPEGRGYPHQARLGRKGALAGPRQPVPKGASPGSSRLLIRQDH